jgi:hypothetical protein
VFQRITYRSVVSGRKMMPRIGQMTGPNARSIQGVKIHMSTTAKRGERSAISANKHPIEASFLPSAG